MLYSANYNHAGAAKTWYGVPGSAADAFEECFKQAMPDLFAAQPDLLLQLVTMLSPSLLVNDGAPYRTDQQPESLSSPSRDRTTRIQHRVQLRGGGQLRAPGLAALRRGGGGALSVLPQAICVVPRRVALRRGGGLRPRAEVARWLVGDLKRVCNEERTAREQLMADGVVRSRRYAPKKLAAAAAAKKLARTRGEFAECQRPRRR